MRSSGAATTATWATSSRRKMMDSTSDAETLNPPTMKNVLLAVDDSEVAVLPQVAHVSGMEPAAGVKAAAVASGASKYPVMTLNPWTRTSPDPPVGWSFPSSSTIRSVRPSRGWPTVVAMVSIVSDGSQMVAVPWVSVRP